MINSTNKKNKKSRRKCVPLKVNAEETLSNLRKLKSESNLFFKNNRPQSVCQNWRIYSKVASYQYNSKDRKNIQCSRHSLNNLFDTDYFSVAVMNSARIQTLHEVTNRRHDLLYDDDSYDLNDAKPNLEIKKKWSLNSALRAGQLVFGLGYRRIS